ncbi:MAG: hypothetical protein R3C44_16610 [Chloroflexota bacterium]
MPGIIPAFSAAGVLSGSFCGGREAENGRHTQSSDCPRNGTATPATPDLRFWFEAGTRDETSDRDNNGVIDAIQDTTELIDETDCSGVPT